MTTNACREEFDLFADEYDDIVLNELQYTAHQRLADQLIPVLTQPEQAHILDLGCGTGLSSDPYFAVGCKVSGADFSPKMLKEAKKRPFHALYERDLDAPFNLKDSAFDAVVSSGVIDFLEDPPQFIARIAEILKSGGYFALTAPLNAPQESDFPVNYFSAEAILVMAGQNGLRPCWQSSFLGYETPENRVEFAAFIFQKN